MEWIENSDSKKSPGWFVGDPQAGVREVQRILTVEGQAILNCAVRLNESKAQHQLSLALSQLHRAVASGKKIVLTGLGKSGKIAQKISATLLSTGSFSVYLHPTEALHGDLAILQTGDVVIALSYTGNTEEILRLVPLLSERKIPFIAIGGNPDSQLARLADVWIDSSVGMEACPHNLAPTSSTTLALALGDALALTLMQMRGVSGQ